MWSEGGMQGKRCGVREGGVEGVEGGRCGVREGSVE